MAASVHAAGVASDHIESIVPPDAAAAGPAHRVQQVNVANNGPSVTPDPAYSIPGLLWNQQRINMTDAWKVTAGNDTVTVGVADTGLDYTHSELAPKVSGVVDFTTTEDPPICKTFVAAPDTSRMPNGRPSSADPRTPTGTATAAGSAATSPRRSTAPASTGSRRRSTSSR